MQDPGRALVPREGRDVPVEGRDRPERRRRPPRREHHAEPPVLEARLVVLGLDLFLARDHAVLPAQEQQWAERVTGRGRVERESALVGLHELAAVRPDERRDADQRGLDAEPVDAGVAIRELDRGVDELPPRPAGARRGDARCAEEVLVVVDNEARDVLRQAVSSPSQRNASSGGS